MENTNMDKDLNTLIKELGSLKTKGMYLDDFLLTWDKSNDEIQATFKVAQILRGLREKNISPKLFDSGLAISLFRDNSTRTRFSYASAANMLGCRFRIWMKARARLPMVRRCVKPPT